MTANLKAPDVRAGKPGEGAMRVTAVVSERGLDSRENDDRAGWAETAAGLYAWVIDGATSIAERDYLGTGQGDVAWYADALSERLAANAGRGAPPQELHAIAAADVAGRYRALAATLAEPPPLYAQPMAALVLMRLLGDAIEIFELGDCAAFAGGATGARRLTVFEPRSDSVEALARRAPLAASRPDWRQHLPALRRERETQLQRDPLRVSTAAPGAVFGGRFDRHDLAAGEAVVLMSDGYERFAEIYGLGDDADMVRRTLAEGPEAVLAEIRTLEAADPDGRRFPRLKPSDDATCLVIARS